MMPIFVPTSLMTRQSLWYYTLSINHHIWLVQQMSPICNRGVCMLIHKNVNGKINPSDISSVSTGHTRTFLVVLSISQSNIILEGRYPRPTYTLTLWQLWICLDGVGEWQKYHNQQYLDTHITSQICNQHRYELRFYFSHMYRKIHQRRERAYIWISILCIETKRGQ